MKKTVAMILLIAGCKMASPDLDDVRSIRQRISTTATERVAEAVETRVVRRETSPTATYFVTLEGVPVGHQLTLDCEWKDPRGNVAHENHYQTRTIDHSPWTTHCRHRFDPESPPGKWTVTIWLGEQSLSTAEFEVR